MTPLAHFYHVYADPDGNWRDIVAGHFRSLRACGLAAQAAIRVGIVGDPEQRDAVAAAILPAGAEIRAEALQGFEQVTLRALWQWARDEAPPGAWVLYAHTKGASAPGSDWWRDGMTGCQVGRWRDRLAQAPGHDAVGCHWIRPQLVIPPEYRAQVAPALRDVPHFSGNFWWARAAYLATLPPPDPGDPDRFRAEGWIGQGNPDVHDACAGSPLLPNRGHRWHPPTGQVLLPCPPRDD